MSALISIKDAMLVPALLIDQMSQWPLVHIVKLEARELMDHWNVEVQWTCDHYQVFDPWETWGILFQSNGRYIYAQGHEIYQRSTSCMHFQMTEQTICWFSRERHQTGILSGISNCCRFSWRGSISMEKPIRCTCPIRLQSGWKTA